MDGAGRIVVGPACRELRRSLRPIEWMVLEEVALDARRDDAGDFVAATSARRVAEHVGLTPSAVARALARLRAAGIVIHARQAGPAGRFGLSAYVLGAVPGLDVMEPTEAPASEGPCPAPPWAARPHIDGPRAVDAHMVAAAPSPGSGGADSAARSLHDVVALPSAVDDLDADERARAVATRSGVKRGRRAATTPLAAQLSILDTADDSELAKNQESS